MSDHYYSARPASGHDRQQIRETLRGRTFTFWTDAGVFAKKGVDFGSKLLIDTMEIPQDAKVLDVGCGYGPIGLTAAHLAEAGSVTMVDINERAVELARENARRNEISNVRVLQSNMLEAVKEERFHCILTNPPIRAGKEVVHGIFEQARECLEPGGELWVVIQKKQGAPSAFAKLESLFASVQEANKAKGFRIFRCRRP
ncbi:methyltransferase [Paenibacillus sp. J31TS4]|uniref:class I SAM-dependent methyltransferase n=1 Tax=Paenibacillus sp. J31TS4 TaxID=2807195 RepID=UPI001AFE8C17|nr:class I SAM-dependent methyltransferase [Paenibacillus sp. J31TS4]GIP41506.1 methyltransferase [Paenibacillus sp. J31TS4]